MTSWLLLKKQFSYIYYIMHVSLHGNDYADLKNFSEKCKSPRMWENLCYVFHVGSQEYLMSKETKTSFKKNQNNSKI